MSKKKTPLDEFAKLLENPSHDLSVEVYTEDIKVIKEPHVKKHNKPKYTLNEIGDALFEFIKTTNKNFRHVNNRIDNLEKRIDKIDTRLDYIVDANNLKDSK